MKKLLFALALFLLPSAGWAQCNGVFAQGMACGRAVGAGSGVPGQVPIGSLATVPGGTPGQIQWNSAGAFAGFTASGDATINASTGVVSILKSGNTNTFGSVTGSFPSGHCVKFDASGNLIDAGGACGTVSEQKNTASVGLATSGNCDNTSTNSGSPCDTHLALNSATLMAAPGNPTGTGSVTAVMAGLGGTCKITPVYSSRIRVTFYGNVGDNTAASGCSVTARFGTGAAPGNGVAVTGTAIGTSVEGALNPLDFIAPFSNGGIVTGLTPSTAYWLDLDQKQSGSGICSITSITCYAEEF